MCAAPAIGTIMNQPMQHFREWTINVIGPDGHVRSWAEIEAEVLECAILSCGGNISAAAAALGTGRGVFYRRLAKLGFRNRSRAVS